jgi:N-acetylneuraminic acid mutarotase
MNRLKARHSRLFQYDLFLNFSTSMRRAHSLTVIFFAVCMTFSDGCRKGPEIPKLITSPVSIITTNSAVSGGTITDDGGAEVTVRGLCWGISENPTTANFRSYDGYGTGTYSSSLSKLSAGTNYYLRAYATNSVGTAYGDQVSFMTNQKGVLPAVETSEVGSITSTSAVSGGNITSDGGDPVTAKGVCWGTTENPTIDNNKTIDGSGKDIFTSIITGLHPNTIYYLKAYASNSGGVAYGSQIIFTTSVAQGGSWAQKANFPGLERFGAVGFSIGTKAYVGLGFSQNLRGLSDFWEWDQVTDVWTRKSDYPGRSIGYAVAFSIGSKGYIGSGVSEFTFTNDFWEYDPAKDLWIQKEPLPTLPGRAYAVGFSIGTKGYIGLGVKEGGSSSENLTYYQDFWEWDQGTNIWTRKSDFTGSVRNDAVGFSIGSKGYIGTGSVGYYGTHDSKEFWEWDQASDTWTKRSDFGGNIRGSAVGFSIGNKGYLGTGTGGAHLCKDFWEWDQAGDQWKEISNFGGPERAGAVAFSIGNKGYILTGSTGHIAFADFWEFSP